MSSNDRIIWLLIFIVLALGVAAVASLATELRRMRRQRERHEASATERHDEELEHLTGIRVAIVSQGAAIGQALEAATEAARATPVMAPPDEILLPPPMPAVDLRVSLPAPPDAIETADTGATEDEIGTATFNRAHMPLPIPAEGRDEEHGSP